MPDDEIIAVRSVDRDHKALGALNATHFTEAWPRYEPVNFPVRTTPFLYT